MKIINSVNRLRHSAGSARRAELAERLSLLTEFIVVIDELRLSDNGIKEAHEAGKAIKAQGLVFDVVFTSLLKRAEETADIILQYCDQKPQILQHWRLNERHYGALTGLNKAEMAEIHGKGQVQIWRRSFDVPPPPMPPEHPYFNEIGNSL